MKVTFTKVHARGYSVSVEGNGIDPAKMNPAPGYDDLLPHDAAHFIVENELGIVGGIFGQIAVGGIIDPLDRNSRVQRKAKRRRQAIFKANEADALFSEHAVWAAQSRWAGQNIVPDTDISKQDLDRIALKFDEFAGIWSQLPLGGSITLEWNPRVPDARSSKRRKSRR